MIPFIMWSLAMVITGATIAMWFHTKKPTENIPKETYGVEER